MLTMASLKPLDSKGAILLSKLTLQTFLKNINESRTEAGQNVNYFCFNESRCRYLSDAETVKSSSKGIIYLMNRDCRVDDNWALLYSQLLANNNDLPLNICVLTKDFNKLYPTKRHLAFALGGFAQVKKQCLAHNIGFYFLKANAKDFIKIVTENNVGAVVTDFSPLRETREKVDYLVKNLPEDVPLIEVDAHNIVPTWFASDKQEYMAKTIRPKIVKQLPEYLTGFPSVGVQEVTAKLTTKLNIDDIEKVWGDFEPRKENVEPVEIFKPGSDEGFDMLLSFLRDKLKFYGEKSNDPSKEYISNMSPWIHFGQISAQRIALEVKSMSKVASGPVEKYLEELVVRRELAENYCLYNSNYDNINGAPDWALKSLELHRKDKRERVYSREEFEGAKTYDECWNAAQRQLLLDGKIHGYMRMYWCKKILEWTKTPEEAIEIALWLNDMYSIDGTDPNGFVGVMWSICGVHDQGWKERPIFGKIRYMVQSGLKRKFDIDSYCARYAA